MGKEGSGEGRRGQGSGVGLLAFRNTGLSKCKYYVWLGRCAENVTKQIYHVEYTINIADMYARIVQSALHFYSECVCRFACLFFYACTRKVMYKIYIIKVKGSTR